jgi:probable HAF family extracellular repeat protein
MFRSLWFRRTTGTHPANRRLGLHLEPLEDRCLLSYSITDLGTLAGPYISSAAYGINAAGQVVGDATGSSGAYQEAFLWQNGVMQDLGVHGHAFGINNANPVQVVGQGITADTPYAFLWQNGTAQDLGGGTATGSAAGVNDSGEVVGWTAPSTAFLWQNGNMQNLRALTGGSESAARAINNSGQVVGYSEKIQYPLGKKGGQPSITFTAVLWQNGKITSLGTLGGANSSATAINDLGQVVGTSDTKTSTGHAFFWDSTHGMQDLSTPGEPLGINGAGQIVGSGAGHAFLWQNGVTQDLNSLIPAGSGWGLASATAINGSGQIVGYGWFHGYQHGYLLTPSMSTTTTLARPATSVPTYSWGTGIWQPLTQTANCPTNLRAFPHLIPSAPGGSDKLVMPAVPTFALDFGNPLSGEHGVTDATRAAGKPTRVLDQFFAEMDAGVCFDGWADELPLGQRP